MALSVERWLPIVEKSSPLTISVVSSTLLTILIVNDGLGLGGHKELAQPLCLMRAARVAKLTGQN
jgi:hypothetical protein